MQINCMINHLYHFDCTTLRICFEDLDVDQPQGHKEVIYVSLSLSRSTPLRREWSETTSFLLLNNITVNRRHKLV